MARKSRELREKQTSDLIGNYERENLMGDYRYRFLCDVKSRLSRGKHLTKKQREWLDSLIKEGVPDIVRDTRMISQINDVINLCGMEHRKGVLSDFIQRLALGKDLTEKQAAFLTGILQEAEKVKESGPYIPSDEVSTKLSQCVLLSAAYSSIYWQTHPGTARALSSVKDWLDGSSDHIDEWSVNKTLRSMSSKLREINDKPYVSPGDLVWCRMGNRSEPETGVVSGCPEITDRGSIVYPVLCSGNLSLLDKQRLSKRKPRNEVVA